MGEPWRREIMRLTKIITGNTIWAGPSKTVRAARQSRRPHQCPAPRNRRTIPAAEDYCTLATRRARDRFRTVQMSGVQLIATCYTSPHLHPH